MHALNLLLLAALFSTIIAEPGFRNYEAECRMEFVAQANLDPCQRACELEKMGLLRDGRFDLKQTLKMVDTQDGLTLYPVYHRNLLKAAILSCYLEIRPMKSVDKCTAASAMYYCIESLLQPEKMYRKKKEHSRWNRLSYASSQREELLRRTERRRSQAEKLRSQRGSFESDEREA